MTTRRKKLSARRLARRRRQRGMAFVLVLGALTLLTVMLTEVQDESSAEFSSALSARDALVAEYAARSAVNLSRLLISTEPMIRQSVGIFFQMLSGGKAPPQIPVWEFSDQVLGAFNDQAGAESFSAFSGLDPSRGKNLGLPGASFQIKVVDEDSKININAASRQLMARVRLARQLMALMTGPQYDPLFERRDADGDFSDRLAICSAIIDWVDPDQETAPCDPRMSETAQDMPAEDSFYEQLVKPYHRRNAPFDSLEELRMVRGMGDDFWATFVDPDPDQPEKRLLTVWGAADALNVNTASPLALLAVVCARAQENTPACTDPVEMQKLLTILTLARSFIPGVPPFPTAKDFVNTLKGQGPAMMRMLLEAVQFQPIALTSEKQLTDELTTESKSFSLYAVGIVRAGKRETRVNIHAVVDFRDAPPPTVEERIAEQLGLNQQPGSSSGTQDQSQEGTGQGADALTRALAPDPGGNVVYFKVD